jgi:hypothetical protein
MCVQVVCSYPADGGSMQRNCVNGGYMTGQNIDCLPGCYTPGGNAKWCTAMEPYDCAWATPDLDQMMRQQLSSRNANYNEVMVLVDRCLT